MHSHAADKARSLDLGARLGPGRPGAGGRRPRTRRPQIERTGFPRVADRARLSCDVHRGQCLRLGCVVGEQVGAETWRARIAALKVARARR
jgi:hypothetical protein